MDIRNTFFGEPPLETREHPDRDPTVMDRRLTVEQVAKKSRQEVFVRLDETGLKKVLMLSTIVILVVAFTLRVWRIDGPYEHFDEKIAVYVSRHLEKNPGWDDNWKKCEIPIFSISDQYNFSTYLYATHLFRRMTAPFLPAKWNKERLGIVVHRLFSVLCSTATVAMLMLMARRIGGGFIMIGTGLLAATNVQLVQDAHYARPEAFMSLSFAVVIWLGFLPEVRVWRPVMMAFLVGLLAAVKFTNAIVFILPVYAIWQILHKRDAGAMALGRFAVILLTVVTLAFVAGWALGVPYALIHPARYMKGVKFLSHAYSGVFPPYTLPNHGPSWPTMRACFLATQGLPLLTAMALGIARCCLRRRFNEIVLLVLPVAGFVFLFGTQKMFVERNLSPVLPFALLLASAGFFAMANWLWQNNLRRIGATLLAAVLLASITGDRAVWLLLREGVTETNVDGYDAYLKGLDRDFPGVRQSFTSFFNENDMDWLKGELMGRHEVLLNVFDFNDAYKKHGLEEMERRFNVFPVAEYRGTFADYPLSGLNNFHGPRMRTYLVRSLDE
jgi:hypothetical protein